MTELRPVSAPERIAVLDVIRGWALLGVLIVNVHEAFSGHRYLPAPTAAPTIDDAATWFIETAISGKSITLLTCLFGLGFTIQMLRAGERGEDGSRLFVRRLGVLFAIGACHATLLWWGDVTWQYAVMGLVLLAFRRASERAVLAWAIFLIFVPRLVLALPGVGDAVRTGLPHPADRAAFNTEVLAAIRGHAYVRTNLRQILYYISSNIIWYFPWLAGRFLLGYYAGKRRLFADGGATHLSLFRRLAAWGLGLGGLAAILTTLRHTMLGPTLALPIQLGYVIVSELAMLGVGVGYASAIVVLMQRAAPRRWLMILAPVGRMPLTIYLTQSVAATFIFYGWGLGLVGQIGAAGCLAISLAIFALQIAVSHAWLRRFRFGPAEWLWRTLVYRRRQPMRVA
jgi:uncharacterized protein